MAITYQNASSKMQNMLPYTVRNRWAWLWPKWEQWKKASDFAGGLVMISRQSLSRFRDQMGWVWILHLLWVFEVSQLCWYYNHKNLGHLQLLILFCATWESLRDAPCGGSSRKRRCLREQGISRLAPGYVSRSPSTASRQSFQTTNRPPLNAD